MITKAYKKVNFERFNPSLVMDREVYFIVPIIFSHTAHIAVQIVMSWPVNTQAEYIDKAHEIMLKNGWEEVPVDSLEVKGEKR